MSQLNGEKVFITGATGFVGSNLVRRYLSTGAEVYINVRTTSDTWRIKDILNEVNVVPLDITEYEKLNDSLIKIRPDFIIHTATYGGRAEQKNTEEIVATNFLGTVNLLRSCRNINISLLINTGSSSEYGLKDSAMQESTLVEPVTEYGASKAASTIYCQALARSENLPVVTLRLFSPYGRYEQKSRLIPSIILAALKKINPRISSRQFVRDFLYIEDVLDAYDAVIEAKNVSGKIFNIGSGKQHSVGEVTDLVLRLTGNEVTCEAGLPRGWTNEPVFWEANIQKAEAELFWKPKYSLEKGLGATIEWFRANRELYA